MRTSPISALSAVRRDCSCRSRAFARAHPLVILAATAVLIGLAPLARAKARGQATAAGCELSVLFAGVTNAPLPTAPLLAISRAPGDLYALFAVTNSSKNYVVEFFTVGAEKRDGVQWHAFVPAVGGPTNYWRQVTGVRSLAPGAGCVAAAVWPTGLPATNAWRLRLSVARAPSRSLQAANDAFGKEIFLPRRRQTMATPEVFPLVAVARH